MRAFTFERAQSPAEAAAAAARHPGAKFVAGGTNLLDLMKLEIEAPTHLIDVNGLGLDKIEATPEGGLRIGALVRHATNASRAAVAARLADSAGNMQWSASAMRALRRIRATWLSLCASWTPLSKPSGPMDQNEQSRNCPDHEMPCLSPFVQTADGALLSGFLFALWTHVASCF